MPPPDQIGLTIKYLCLFITVFYSVYGQCTNITDRGYTTKFFASSCKYVDLNCNILLHTRSTCITLADCTLHR